MVVLLVGVTVLQAGVKMGTTMVALRELLTVEVKDVKKDIYSVL